MKLKYIRQELKALPMALAFLGLGAVFMFAPHLALGIIAGMLFLIAGMIIAENHLLGQRGYYAQGAVVDHQEREECFIPVVEFKDRENTVKRLVTKTGCGVKKPAVGTRVVIIYDPDGKNGCEIDTFARRWGGALAIAGLGFMFVVGATMAK